MSPRIHNRRGRYQCFRQELIMKIGFLTHNVPGHLHPFTALARRVQARGHNVAMIGFLDGEPLVRAAKLPFIPFCEQEHPAGTMRELVDQLSKLKGLEAVEFTFNAFAHYWIQS
jgi:zeaxanthin glucosyltransferase